MRNEQNWRDAAMRRFAVAALILFAGLVILVLAGSSIVGWAVVAAALMIATSMAFLEVGYSEDRARARDTGRESREQSRRASFRPHPR